MFRLKKDSYWTLFDFIRLGYQLFKLENLNLTLKITIFTVKINILTHFDLKKQLLDLI